MDGISNKLFNLYSFLKGKALTPEANDVSSLSVFAASDTYVAEAGSTWVAEEKEPEPYAGTMVVEPIKYEREINEFGQEEGTIGPRRDIHNALLEIGADPIRYIGGKSLKWMRKDEAKEKGLIRSGNGDIFEVIYEGKKSIAKVLRPGDSEPEKWKRIINADLGPEVKKHLPEIRAIKPLPQLLGTPPMVIIMEKLGPLSQDIRDMFTLGGDVGRRGTKDMLKDEGFIHKAVSLSASNALLEISDMSIFDGMDEEQHSLISKYLNSLSNSLNVIINNIVSDILKGNISYNESWAYSPPEGGSTGLEEIVEKYVRQVPRGTLEGNTLDIIIDELSSKISNNIKDNFTPTSRAIAKYYTPSPATRKQDPLEETYTENKDRYLYAEHYAPETKSLFFALQALKENNILWFDVHSENIMQRIENNSHGGPGDLVLIDVALYGTKDEINKYI